MKKINKFFIYDNKCYEITKGEYMKRVLYTLKCITKNSKHILHFNYEPTQVEIEIEIDNYWNRKKGDKNEM